MDPERPLGLVAGDPAGSSEHAAGEQLSRLLRLHLGTADRRPERRVLWEPDRSTGGAEPGGGPLPARASGWPAAPVYLGKHALDLLSLRVRACRALHLSLLSPGDPRRYGSDGGGVA